MLFEELKNTLENLSTPLEVISEFWNNTQLEEKYQSLHSLSEHEEFWKHPEQAAISKELQACKIQREEFLYIINTHKDLLELTNLFKNDEEELSKLSDEVDLLAGRVRSFKVALLLHDPQDDSPCFLSINAGAGGTESQDWADMLLRMYLRFCEKQRFQCNIIDYQAGEEAGVKSVTLFVKGKKSFGLLKSEMGIHRLVRISPFDANKRRHTSFCAVLLTPEVPEIEVSIDPGDLRIDTYRAGGAGGQHVNKTESAVRITHLPTNIVVQCQSERSQNQNKETALKMLRAKMAQKLKEEQDAKAASIEKKKIEWGSQIRSYVLHPYKMVKDHRTSHESPQPDLVLDGELMPFIEAFLIWSAKR